MSAAVPTTEPKEIFAGDSIHFTKTLADYPASSWSLVYRLLKQQGAEAETITATADGNDFEVEVARTETAGWQPGEWWLIGYVTSGTERVQIYSGRFTVKADPATSTAYDGRTYLERILALLEEVIEKGVIRETIEYSYGGVASKVVSMEDALNARDRIKAAIAQEAAQASGKNRRILTKFTSPLIVLILALCGCTSLRQELSTETRHPDGTVETKKTTVKATAFWDSRQSLEKLRVSNGKTHSVGLAAMDSESASTNIVRGLEAIAAIISGLK